jgi:hypothetical protein
LDRLQGHSPAPPRILLLEDAPASARTVIDVLQSLAEFCRLLCLMLMKNKGI